MFFGFFFKKLQTKILSKKIVTSACVCEINKIHLLIFRDKIMLSSSMCHENISLCNLKHDLFIFKSFK